MNDNEYGKNPFYRTDDGRPADEKLLPKGVTGWIRDIACE